MIWKITLPSNKSYFLTSEPSSYEELLDLVRANFNVFGYIPFTLKYIDAEDEFINLSSPEDFDTAILSAKRESLHTMQIFVLAASYNRKINRNSLKPQIPNSSENNPNDLVPFSNPFPQRKRTWTTYMAAKPSHITHKKPYKSKLPLINEAQILQQGQMTLNKFGGLKRTRSCPGIPQTSSFHCLYGRPELNLSPKNLKSVCLRFIDKFAEDKISRQIKEEVQDIIPVLVELLKEAWQINGPKTKNLAMIEEGPKICCQCNLPAKNVRYICPGCVQNNRLSNRMNVNTVGHTYGSHSNYVNNAKNASLKGTTKEAKEASSRLEAKKANNNLFSHQPALRKSISKKMHESYKVSLLRVVPDEPQEVKASESYKVSFELKNCGSVKWPDNIKLVCINGHNKGNEKMLPSLDPGRKIKVEISLHAPETEGKYLSQWRVSYGKGKKYHSFGESLFEEVHINSERTKHKNKHIELNMNHRNHIDNINNNVSHAIERGRQEQKEEDEGSKRKKSATSDGSWTSESKSPDSGVEKSQMPSKITCQEDRMKCAKFLNEVFPGDLEEKINFIKKFLEEVTIFDVVEKYLMTLGKTKAPNDRQQEVH